MSATISDTTAQLQLTQKGGPFKLVHVPKPVLAPEEVLIRQRAIGFNLLDAKQRDTGLGIASYPHVLGIEGAGVIEAVGSNVASVKVGDEVMAWEGNGAGEPLWGGAYQERVAVPAKYVAKKPKNLSLEDAASLPICFITAAATIVVNLKTPLPFLPTLQTEVQAPPSSVLILGGSSGVGAAAIQLLRTAYPSLPILATSSPKNNARLTELGATSVLDYRSASVVADIKAASPGGIGVDVIIDCVSAGASQTDICDVIDPSGTKRYVAVLTGVMVMVPEGIEISIGNMKDILQLQGGEKVVPSLTELVEKGIYKAPLTVRVLGHGLEALPDVLDEIKTVSGERLVFAL